MNNFNWNSFFIGILIFNAVLQEAVIGGMSRRLRALEAGTGKEEG